MKCVKRDAASLIQRGSVCSLREDFVNTDQSTSVHSLKVKWKSITHQAYLQPKKGSVMLVPFCPQVKKKNNNNIIKKKKKKKPHMEHEAVMVTFSLQGQQQNSSQHDSEFSLTVNAVALWKSPFLLQNVQRAVKDIPGRIYWSLRKRVQVKVLRNSVGVCELRKVCVILHRVDVYVEVSPASCLFPADSGIMQHYTHSLQTPPRVKNGSAVS